MTGIRAGISSVYRAERRKLVAQVSTRALALVCALGPIAFAVILNEQSGVPADTLLGVWVHSSGYAVPFVVLGFGGFWGLPVLAGVIAGDLFSSEDRFGTWKTVLTRSASRGEVFAGKLLAAATFALALLALVALSSLAAGLLLTGDQPLVGLGGAVVPSGECLELVLASWLLSALPLLAFTSVAALLSVLSRNGIVGVLGPVLIGLVMQLLALIGTGRWVHMLLIASAFDDWHGLLASPKFYGPLIIGSCACVIWTIACLGVAWRSLRTRDFAGTPVTRRRGWLAPARAVLATAALIVLLGAASNWGPAAITKDRVEASVGSIFDALTVLQQQQLGRSVPKGAKLNDRIVCRRRAGASSGPGDWSCTISVATPQPGELETGTYDLSVESDGCYKAQAPPAFVGQQTMSDSHGHTVVNPLFTIYGCFDITAPAKGCGPTPICVQAAGQPASGRPGTDARSTAETRALHEAERAAGAAVIRKITEAEHREARASEAPAAEEAEPPPVREPGK